MSNVLSRQKNTIHRYLLTLAVCMTGVWIILAFQPHLANTLMWRVLGDINQPTARHENAYVEVNGSFYLLGGRGTRPIQIYNPTDSTWSTGLNPPIELHHFQGAVLGDTIYILAAYTGEFPDETAVANIYKYATNSNQWVTGSVIPEDRRRGSAGVSFFNGKFYVVCGSTGGHGTASIRRAWFDQYDPATDTWTPLADAPRVRDHVHTAIVGNKLYVAGGRNGAMSNAVPEVDVYDFSTSQWSTLPTSTGNIPTPRSGAASVAVGNFLVVIGGETNQTLAHNEVEGYNTSTSTWVTLDPLNTGRHGTQAFFYNDNIYIVAGSGQMGGSPELTSHEVYETNGETNLPVELSPDFFAIADTQSIRLNWRTLSETNNAGFEVQHETEIGFEAIGFVNGHGTAVTPHDYEFTARELDPGRHVFRLKQIDFDGKFEYSPQISAFIEVGGRYYLGKIYPNPFNPQARFSLTLVREQHVNIRVYDMLGREVAVLFEGSLQPYQPYSFSIESDGWAGGRYLLQVRGTYFSASQGFTMIK